MQQLGNTATQKTQVEQSQQGTLKWRCCTGIAREQAFDRPPPMGGG